MVTPEETFHELLGLGDSWGLIRTEYEGKNNTFVNLRTGDEQVVGRREYEVWAADELL